MKISELQVDEFTTPCPQFVTSDMPITEVMNLMESKGVRHIPVVENEKPVGLISDRDVKVFSNPDFADKFSAKDVMIDTPFSAQSTDLLSDVVYEMSKRKIGSAVIKDENGDLQGIFTSIDAMNALIEVLRGEVD